LKVEKEDSEKNICPYCHAKLRLVIPYGLFSTKPPDIEIELLVDLEGWRYVEYETPKIIQKTPEQKLESRLNRVLSIANSGVVTS